jgi:enediyne biosynthesis protein E4
LRDTNFVNVRRWAVLLCLGAAACRSRSVDTTWHDEAGYRWRELDVPARGSARAGFSSIASSSSGITHRNDVDDEHALANRHLLIGAGAAAGDVDGDGLPDLFLASVERPAALYKNNGRFMFTDVTASSGIDVTGLATTSATFADVNGDGALDLIVGTLGGPVKLWLGDGKGQFTDATAAGGVPAGYAATTMTLADVDGDGDLDLYVGTYKTRNTLDAYPPQLRAFDQVVKKIGDTYVVVDRWKKEYRIEDHPELGGIVRSQRAEPDLFLLNDGAGHFTRVPLASSPARFTDEKGKPLAEEPDYFTLASRFYDVNGDGAPDLYVCNDFEDPDQFWINDGKGNFRQAPALAVRETSNTCMSVDFGDIDRDGHVDFFTADMMGATLASRQRYFPTHTPTPKAGGLATDRQQWMRNALLLSRGDGTWASIGDFAGVSGTEWTWGSAFLDVDLDGYEDLIALNGHRWDVRDADTFERIRNSVPRVAWNREQGAFPKSATRSFAFRNNRDLTFSDLSREWGIGLDEAISQGIALADLDGDGDLDVVATRLDAPPMLYRNDATAPRIAVRLKGKAPNDAGIGAKVTVRAPSLPPQTREMTAGGYYLSGSDAELTFAAPRDSAAAIDVRWRDGSVTRVPVARANRLYEVQQSAAVSAYATTQPAAASPALFENATATLSGATHVDSVFDDYRRQPLLPNRFSQLGPGVTWADVDGDGKTDLVVGTGRGGKLAVLRNAGARFAPIAVGPAATGDFTTILPVPDPASGGGIALVAGQSNYEASSASEALLIPRVVGFQPRGRIALPTQILPGDSASVGPLALGDVNGDGRLDLFVGARAVPGAWPLPAPSRIYLRGADGRWTLDSANVRALASIGLVSAALFTDLDGDGRPELVTTSEWGPVRVFHNEGASLRDVTREWGMSDRTSRWNGLSAGDFDGDGALDLVVTSWGRNTPWQATPNRPYVLLVGNFGGQGLGLLFARRDSVTGTEMPLESFERVTLAVPSARDRIASFAAYSRASADDVLGDRKTGAVRVGATTFDHLLLLNRRGKFEARPLPNIAQLAPAFAPVVADFDGDGHEDLFLAQNFSPTEIETPRFDAGAGLVLLGDGRGDFRPLSIGESGIQVLGDQRGAAASDYDGDGRADLAVSQNGAPMTLWHNRAARPGLRVKLNAGRDNPNAVGAQLRVGDGPVREIRAGSAYWSVDDPIVVLASRSSATELWIRWPGGAEQRVPVAAGQREATVARR